MRADRLLTLMLMLQESGKMTARQLAQKLEVSERTIYRDIDALSAAGVPVYTEQGREGGCLLMDDYRTTLTGLTEDEVKVVFMLSIPSALDDLGLGEDFRNAMLKLSAALPLNRQVDQAQVRQRIHLDLSSERDPAMADSAAFLQLFYQAVWDERKVCITSRLPFDLRSEWIIEPFGLVAKAGQWQVICRREGHMQVYRLSRIVSAHMLDEMFDRPESFDLAVFWDDWSARIDMARQTEFVVEVRVSPDLTAYLPHIFGNGVQANVQETITDPAGWMQVKLFFESFETARSRLLGFGGAVEVLSPEPLRLSVADFARQTAALYDRKTTPS